MVEVLEIPVRTLGSIFSEHLPAQTEIDFMGVDVEGIDLSALMDNDWQRYRPHWIMVELTRSAQEILDLELELDLALTRLR